MYSTDMVRLHLSVINKSDRNLGFRCAMIRVGGSEGNEDTGGNHFKESGKKMKRRFK